MTAATITRTDYLAARADGGADGWLIPARSALQLARYRASAPDWHGLTPTGEGPGRSKPIAVGVVDGFTVSASVVADEYPSLDWLGTFTEARDRYGERVPRPDPSAILWTNRGTWRLKRGEHWYTPTESLAAIEDYYRKAGASRSVAREYALADIRRRADQDADEMDRGEFFADVRVTRGGVELGRANVGGLVPSADTWALEVCELLPDIMAEALAEARQTLASLCAPDDRRATCAHCGDALYTTVRGHYHSEGGADVTRSHDPR